MNETREKIPHILGYLSDQLARAYPSFWTAKLIDQAKRVGRITSARSFFAAAYLGCAESAVLALSRLTAADKDSINVQYLLNCCEKSPRVFPHAPEDEILHSVFEFRKRLADIGVFLDNVKVHRDRTIAHLDRKYVNEPSAISGIPPVNMGEVERVFELLLAIINTFRGYLDGSELRLDRVGPNVAEDLEYLLGLIEGANAKP